MHIIALSGCQPVGARRSVPSNVTDTSCRGAGRRSIVSPGHIEEFGWISGSGTRRFSSWSDISRLAVRKNCEFSCTSEAGTSHNRHCLAISAQLRLARVPTPEGVRYTVADGTLSSAARRALDALLPQLLTRVDGVGELIVVRTVPGGAQPVASALDGESWPDVLGTVGGDDTILVVCRSSAARERLERRLRKLAEI